MPTNLFFRANDAAIVKVIHVSSSASASVCVWNVRENGNKAIALWCFLLCTFKSQSKH